MFDLRPIIFLLVPPLAAMIAWAAKLFYPDIRFRKAFAIAFGGCIAAYWFFLFGPFIDVKTEKTFEMNWSLGEPAKEYPGESHVILTFTKYPNHFTGYYSAELANYLKSTGKKTVDVTFEVTSDYGKMRGYHEIRFGNLVLKKAPANSYGGHGDSYFPSPWRER